MRIIDELVRKRNLYLLALPGFIFLIIFAYLPMSGHLIAFKDYDFRIGILKSEWAGLKNFEFFFLGDHWIKVTFNTMFLNFLFIFFGLGTGVLLALFLNEIRSVLSKRGYSFLPWTSIMPKI